MRLDLLDDGVFGLGLYCLPTRAMHDLHRSLLVIHAGDISDFEALERLRGIGPPVVAVRGNVEDNALGTMLPHVEQIVVAGWTIGVIHDAGPSRGRLTRMKNRFPMAAAVVFGHAHI